MSNITALLTGVCMYPAVGYPALPLCANDVQAVKKALIAGLNVSESSITIWWSSWNSDYKRLNYRTLFLNFWN